MPLDKPIPFRPDIAGLRAWAVLAVMLFHFGVPGFGGGFVGVDIFFAISGFLMTRIIRGARATVAHQRQRSLPAPPRSCLLPQK